MHSVSVNELTSMALGDNERVLTFTRSGYIPDGFSELFEDETFVQKFGILACFGLVNAEEIRFLPDYSALSFSACFY